MLNFGLLEFGNGVSAFNSDERQCGSNRFPNLNGKGLSKVLLARTVLLVKQTSSRSSARGVPGLGSVNFFFRCSKLPFRRPSFVNSELYPHELSDTERRRNMVRGTHSRIMPINEYRCEICFV